MSALPTPAATIAATVTAAAAAPTVPVGLGAIFTDLEAKVGAVLSGGTPGVGVAPPAVKDKIASIFADFQAHAPHFGAALGAKPTS